MSNKNKITYEIVTHRDEATGDIIVPLPQELLEQLGWVEGDQLAFDKDTEGRLVVTKVSK
jgi:bifunctional DNA-binding transcriptional regulator/antitoxin component of YhaV-PrlF toxin-antitoxin module